MKNNAKRLLAFLLAALLCVTMVVPAFATEADAAHDHDHKVSCDADCTHECETKHANSEVIEVVKSVCTAAGYTLKYCFDCEHYFVADVVPAEEGAAHNPGDKVEEGKAATCVSEGVETFYKCTVCGELCDKDGGEVNKLEIIDHEYKDGLCVLCGKHEDDSCVGEHTWEFVEVSVKPTATTNGTAKYKCTVCGAIKEVVILAENARFYPSSLYADIDFADGKATDRLGNVSISFVGNNVAVTDTKLTFNGVDKTVEALKVSAAKSYAIGTFTKLDTIEKMNNFLQSGFSIEVFYIDNAHTDAVQGVVCATQWVGNSTKGHGWGIATQKANDKPYFLTGHGSGYNVLNATADVKVGDLVHVVATYNAETATHTIYVNGTKWVGEGENKVAQSISGVKAPAAPNTTFSDGKTPLFNAFFMGADVAVNTAAPDYPATDMTIADVKFYSSALTDEEVEMLYGYVVEDFTEKEVVDEYAWVKEILAANNLKFEDYEVLELSPVMHSFWNSTDGSKHSTIINAANNTATNHVNFWTTSVFENAEIPAGSLLVVKEGYQYRPDGWQNFGEKNTSTRPGNVKDALTTIDTAWYSNFTSRAFNISRVDGTAVTEADLGTFVVLVPKTHTCDKDTLTKVDAVAGTCTEKGTIAHYECSCGKLYADAEAKTLLTSIEGDFGHTYGENPTEFVDATCEKYGYKLWACTKCGDVKAENIAPKGHANWDDEDRATNVDKDDATCKADGKITWTCDCGKAMEEKLTATGCTLVTVEVKATCSTYAFTYTYCSNKGCDAPHVAVPEGYFATVSGKYEGEKDTTTGKWVAENLTTVVEFEITGTELDATNHFHAVIGEVSTEANCKNEGTKVDYCLGCHEIDKSYTYGPEGHKFGAETEVSKATCTAAAQYKKVCELCGHVETYTKGEALGHKYGDVQTTPATCAAKGEKYKVCSVCANKVVVEVLEFTSSAVNGVYADYETAAKEHVLVGEKENYRPGDCLNIGLDRYTCEKCGDVFVQTGKGGEGHVVGEIKVPAVAPTCTTAGNTAGYICSACGAEVASLPLAALGHTMTEVVAKDETCDEDGDVAHFHCATCGKNFKDAEGTEEITTAVVIPATGHNFVAGVCTECNYTCTHTLDLIEISIADCKDKGTYGYKYFACDDCGYECWTNFVDIPAHEYEEGVITVKPNCTTKGEKADVCTGCGKKENVVVLPETHYNEAGDAIIDSCIDTTEDRLCVVCNTTIGKAHNEITTVVDNTCTTLGYTIVACGDCGEVISTVANTTLGDHKYGTPVIVDSTYTKEGTKTEVCTECGYNKVTTIEKKSGLNIDLVASNKYGYDAYVDGSYVTVKVVADANNVNLWSYRINVNYNKDVLKYVGTTIATTVCDTTVSGLANNNGDYVTLLGYASNDADANMQNVVLNGEDIVIAEITFQVNSAAETEAKFEVAVVDMIEKDNTDVVAKLGDDLTTGTEEITTEIYLDINDDGVRDIEDLNSMVKLMKNIADEDVIEAAADANHDGKISEADLAILMQLLVGAKTYTTYATMAK